MCDAFGRGGDRVESENFFRFIFRFNWESENFFRFTEAIVPNPYYKMQLHRGRSPFSRCFLALDAVELKPLPIKGF
ncbi:hypothetical protein PN499_23300 [Kamptonema animale CS-326]|jgi:hypothetical protein|uniref:hypothetical protein n=1 Tax=Kamptonema animale TaxID=92934 RepID=UPI00232BB394|nr:hypothetical protein [Kamptonema animale]MDB9514132.1 hypothetical protein [Kamptonema animale CS-326]